MNIDKALQLAITHHRNGDLKQAESLYIRVLKKQPYNVDVLLMLGVIYTEFKDYDKAINYIKKALQINPSNAFAYYSLGNTLRKKGLLDEAIKSFQNAISLKPYYVDAYFNIALTLQTKGQNEEAIIYYEKVLHMNANHAEAQCNLGTIFKEKGQYDKAIDYYQKALNQNPNLDEAHCGLGIIFRERGQFNEAIYRFYDAIKLNPGIADAYREIGLILQEKEQSDEALIYYQKALQINPADAEVYYNLGNFYKEKNQYEEAIFYYQKATELNPDIVNAYCNLGIIFQENGQIDKAIAYNQKALDLNPDIAEAHNNLGVALKEKDEFEEAIICFQKAIQKKPDYMDAYNNLGIVLMNKCEFEGAIDYFQKAIQIEPDHTDSHWNMSFSLLLLGNFKEGWKEYEWRRKKKNYMQLNFSQPLWDGSDIAGQTILLYTEQGFGDGIQFIRYVPLVVKRGAKVIIQCQKELMSLFQNVEGIHQIIAVGEQLPSFDLYFPLLSLPLVFGTTIETIPAEIPYIKVNTALLQKWKDKVKDDNSKFKVGLSWAGSPTHKNDRNRSFPLDTFTPLAQFDNIIFYSLQKGKGSEQAKGPPDGMKLIDYTDEINDFSDTAALIENLDLVISADTAVAHLAGALGKPVWTLLPFLPDWRWMLNREDSPWYPTMRLFRQPSYGNWKSVIEKVKEEIEKISKDTKEFISKATLTVIPACLESFRKEGFWTSQNDSRKKDAGQASMTEQFQECDSTYGLISKLSEISGQNKQSASFVNQEISVKQVNEGEMEKLPDEDDFYQKGEDIQNQKEDIAIILNCEGMGDCLFAMAVIKKLYLMFGLTPRFFIFTHRPELFKKCPYIEEAHSIHDANKIMQYQKRIELFDTSQMPHWLVDTFDFISIPAGIGELSFREKQLEYFPVEEDHSEHYDVVINTSETWPSRSWPVENWQKVADYIIAQGFSVAVVGKDTFSKADKMWKRSQGLKGCVDLTNKLSLDQTYYAIKNCDLFITCQNGLSVLSGATDTEIIVLDMSIEWSKRAIYRNEDPHYKVTYVKGNCQLYCCSSFECPAYSEFRCIPTVEQVLAVVSQRLPQSKR